MKNMHTQIADRDERLPRPATARSAVVAVCAGDGNARLFRELGARVVEGGQTMNPPTSELLAALESAAARGGRAAPEQQERAARRRAGGGRGVAPGARRPDARRSRQGWPRCVAFDPRGRCRGELREMAEAAARGPRGRASPGRPARRRLDGVAVAEGEYLGLVDGQAVAAGPELDAVADEVVARLLAEPADVLTILVGEDDPDLAALRDRIAAAHPEVEIEVAHGGQPHYPLLLGAE